MTKNKKIHPKRIPGKGPSQLIFFFKQNGYFRIPDRKRKKEGSQVYKKGYEIRLLAATRKELKIINILLKKSGFKPGKPFTKGTQFVQPVYGKEAVKEFRHLLAKYKKVV
ncbi:MAG TPA: hypothetical protein VET23_10635 [Chitinophagaceae bacterium]|nr:hypothetical protein [Chitinophagaceae bacterium]